MATVFLYVKNGAMIKFLLSLLLSYACIHTYIHTIMCYSFSSSFFGTNTHTLKHLIENEWKKREDLSSNLRKINAHRHDVCAQSEMTLCAMQCSPMPHLLVSCTCCCCCYCYCFLMLRLFIMLFFIFSVLVVVDSFKSRSFASPFFP